MRVNNKQALKRMVKDGALGERAARQIGYELEGITSESKKGSQWASGNKRSAHAGVLKQRSPAESALEKVLVAEFGWWNEGGELVAELHPFEDRQVRVDFAIPRWRIYLECDGWTHHGAFLAAHHNDRARGMLFSARDWLPFRVSYKQAVEEGDWIVQHVREAMENRVPAGKGEIHIESKQMPSGGCWSWIIHSQNAGG